MVQVIPARIENGQVIPEQPLPPADKVEKVSIVVELASPLKPPAGPPQPPHPEEQGMLKWYGILKDYYGDPKEDYRKHLEEKYL